MSGMKELKAHDAHSQPELPTNTVTYALAAVLSIVGRVFLLIKAYPLGAAAVVSALVCGLAFVAVFTVGTLCHILPRGSRCRAVLRRLDDNAVCVLSIGVFSTVFAVTLGGPEDAAWGYALAAVAVAGACAACSVSAFAAGPYKLICLAAYVVVGFACVVRMARIVDIAGLEFFWWLLGGGAAYFAGVVLCAFIASPVGHTVWHLFVMCGAALHFVCVYLFVL